jgi:hypothetical protein
MEIFGPKEDEVIGGWRKMHNEELHTFLSSAGIIRMIKSRSIRGAEHAARMGEKRNVDKFLMGKPEGKRSLGRTSSRWENYIKMYLKEIG